MSGVETRTVSRDSLFLLATIRVEQEQDLHKVRVRNLSDGGMMGEGKLRVQRGNRLEIELRNIGMVEGEVAWVQDDRFGIAFDKEIDSQLVKQSKPLHDQADDKSHDVYWAHRVQNQQNTGSFRKI